MYSVEKGEKTLYVLTHAGDVVAWGTDKNQVIFEAFDIAQYHINDFLRYRLPLKLNEDMRQDFDLYLYAITNSQKVELPFQDWVDEYYDIQRYDAKAEPYNEYQKYLELKEKWEGKECPPNPNE